MTVNELKEALKNGKVRFSYRKKDGSEREAYGTMKAEFLPKPKEIEEAPADQQQKAVENAEKQAVKRRVMPADSVIYFDLDKNSFRSFKVQNFIDGKAD